MIPKDLSVTTDPFPLSLAKSICSLEILIAEVWTIYSFHLCHFNRQSWMEVNQDVVKGIGYAEKSDVFLVVQIQTARISLVPQGTHQT